jgi:hypothetical protein
MMKKKIAALLAILLGCFAATAQTSGELTLHGEYDMSTNAPNISIRHLDNTVVNLGQSWLTPVVVQSGDVWTVNYPCTDDQLGNTTWGPQDPVVLTGLYTTYIGGTVVVSQDVVWIRLPRGNSGASYQLFVDTNTPYSVRYKMLSLAPVCHPLDEAARTKKSKTLMAKILSYLPRL